MNPPEYQYPMWIWHLSAVESIEGKYLQEERFIWHILTVLDDKVFLVGWEAEHLPSLRPRIREGEEEEMQLAVLLEIIPQNSILNFSYFTWTLNHGKVPDIFRE